MQIIGAMLATLSLQAGYHWEPESARTTAEFRGLHAPRGGIVWAAGRGGVVARTVDGGVTWDAAVVPDAGHLFFVDVHAIGARTAWLLGTAFDGNEGRIYRTDDGGVTWRVQYSRTAPGMFLDGMAFWNASHGVAFGDPVGGTFVVLVTEDGGDTWNEVEGELLPASLEGEAAFAASGTAIVTYGAELAWFGTGGADHARVFRTDDGGHHWSVVSTPLPAGPSAGIFGLAFRDPMRGVAVGGDYRDPGGSERNLLRTDDGGVTWTMPDSSGLVGVQYGVVHIVDSVYLATGPTGTSMSLDDGRTWSRIDETAYNTAAAAGSLGAVWAAGPAGRVARLAEGAR